MKSWIPVVLTLSIFSLSAAPNQTDTYTPVVTEEGIPFSLQIEEAPFLLPTGLQAYASGVYKGEWVFLAGRTNGLHDFSNVGNNFPPQFQNTTVYIVDPKTGASYSRSLTDTSSGLSQHQIDLLSATASQAFQKGSTLYVVGGYGVDSATGDMGTKSTLTAIDLKKLVSWVKTGAPSVQKAITQVSHPLLQVTGGFLYQNNNHEPFLLMLGQNFAGLYRGDSSGVYTQQIRKFWLNETKDKISILPLVSDETFPDYRRRDLNIVPVLIDNRQAYVVFSGVFTLDVGIWTVPIVVYPDGSSFELNPNDPETFKQAMNNYNCPSFELYSVDTKQMYVVLPGGISYGYFSGGQFQTDLEFPFINQVTTIKFDKHLHFSQHLMNAEYPFIASTGSNPGNQLLFGAEAVFFPAEKIPLFSNGVIRLDDLPKKPTLLGYIAGGIMSTLPNTNTGSDSTASPYVFKVTLTPK